MASSSVQCSRTLGTSGTPVVTNILSETEGLGGVGCGRGVLMAQRTVTCSCMSSFIYLFCYIPFHLRSPCSPSMVLFIDCFFGVWELWQETIRSLGAGLERVPL